ncbi:hypothetical protein [Rhodococcus spongiicola]|uniref:Uncharacterized protein n=1 Tax=Rhodococcus spongiicola TaxID=2487352 RepID=A0A3S3A850_9NOCA|nr:hypothetical protein [Rhodococcus spongiicola]RVW01821.1 hypothetical protein EF834_14230 [Rhodococcus spongiicola]
MTEQWPGQNQQQSGQPDPWPGTPRYPAGPPQPPGQDPMRPVVQQQKPVPADIVTAFQLWLGVAALGVVHLVAVLLFLYNDRAAFVDQFLDDVATQSGQEVTRAQAEQLLAIGLVITGVLLAVVLGGLTVLFAFKMRGGRSWARVLLTMAGAFVVFSAMQTVVSGGPASGSAALVMGAAVILQAVMAVGAIVLMYRQGSNEYFAKLPPER